MRIFMMIFTAAMLMACQPQQNTNSFNPGAMAKEAPPELMHWGKMVGQWVCTEEGLKPDGSGWQSAGTSDWGFLWSFDGWGIQDNYTSPSMAEPLEDESKRQRGINLRIYNPAEEKWILTWLTTAAKKPMSITALSDDEKIVMLVDNPNPQGFYSRITFFDIKDTTFEWKMEQSKDQQNWREVYRIHGKRKS